MFENERLVKEFAKAEKNARLAFITGLGTASMEALVMNVFTSQDKVLEVHFRSLGETVVFVGDGNNDLEAILHANFPFLYV